MTTSEIATVLAWHDALNEGDEKTLLELSADDIEFADTQGAGQGLGALREWAAQTETTLRPGRMYVHHGVVVCEESATGAVPAGAGAREEDAPRTIACAFRVVEDQVTSVFAHVDLDEALTSTGLTEEDLADG